MSNAIAVSLTQKIKKKFSVLTITLVNGERNEVSKPTKGGV